MSRDDEAGDYRVLVNGEGQYCLWPVSNDVPPGWCDAGRSGKKSDCLAFVSDVWRDMRPTRLRRRTSQLEAIPACENATIAEGNGCLHEMFAQHAKRTPAAVALVHGNRNLSYQELEERSNQLAHQLVTSSVGPDVAVGLCVERSIDAVVGLLGILKAGGAYLPLDPSYPTVRLRSMLDAARASILVMQGASGLAQDLGDVTRVCVDLQRHEIAAQPRTAPQVPSSTDDLACVMYTSGSTGVPKGVGVTHANIRALIDGMAFLNVGPGDVLLQLAPLAFDASTFELWGSLARGAKLVLFPEASIDMREVERLVRAEGVTVLHLTSGLFSLAVEQIPETLSSLRALLTGGDIVSLADFRRMAGESRQTRLIACYGPTECTTFSTCFVANGGLDELTSVPLGCALQHTEIYVLDEGLAPVAAGMPGEVYVAGAGITRGYLYRPDESALKFIANPFAAAGQRMYRTGDWVRRRVDGGLEFIGRRDDQVKIRGYRVELGEIEAALASHTAVRAAAVLPHEDALGERRLVGYVIPDIARAKAMDAAYFVQGATESVSQWKDLYDQTYNRDTHRDGPSFVGWNSSYTGEAIPEVQMQEWLDCSVERIETLTPRRVLEVGCGVGLLLERLGGRCEEYWATDFSRSAIARLQALLQTRPDLRGVHLVHANGMDFDRSSAPVFDAVVLNSVVQSFPDVEYLLNVLEGALQALGERGHVFIGDVRHLQLLKTFHSSVQLATAADGLSVRDLKRRILRSVRREKELVIDPRFFLELLQHFPKVSEVEVQLKRGRFHNELTRYRYDVVLHVGERCERDVATISTLNPSSGDVCDELAEYLKVHRPEALWIRDLANSRLSADLALVRALGTVDDSMSVDTLRCKLRDQEHCGVDPELIWKLGRSMGYSVRLHWSQRFQEEGRFHAELLRDNFERANREYTAAPVSRIAPAACSVALGRYANTPLMRHLEQTLVPRLREHLRHQLPEYMMPSALVALEGFPISHNGKVDRNALLLMEDETFTADYIAPRDAMEHRLAAMWKQILRLDRVGVYDDFFERGGNSLLTLQLVGQVARETRIEVPLRVFAKGPTIAELADYLRRGAAAPNALPGGDGFRGCPDHA